MDFRKFIESLGDALGMRLETAGGASALDIDGVTVMLHDADDLVYGVINALYMTDNAYAGKGDWKDFAPHAKDIDQIRQYDRGGSLAISNAPGNGPAQIEKTGFLHWLG